MSDNYSVVIGSYALNHYGYECDINDIDLLTNTQLAKDIFYICNRKENNMGFIEYENNVHKIDVLNCNDAADKYIFEICNKKFNTIKNTLFGQIDVIIPPLEILYMIKKSHIHRILQLTKINSQDLEIWEKHMKMYHWMRQKLNYDIMDMIVYGDKKYGNPLVTLDDPIENNEIFRKIFIMKFDKTNKTVGDSVISMDQTDEDFFKDNVERFIDHDDLHKKVALMCRNTDQVLYEKYKKDLNNANLDMELFLQCNENDSNETIQCLREEIMVLLMERKWIPEIVKCNVRPKIPCADYDIAIKSLELREIIAHFLTNLCGQGHSWLRQYGLDHYHILSKVDSYNFDDMYNIVLEITGGDKIASNLKKKNFDTFIKNIPKNNLTIDNFMSIKYNYHTNKQIGDGQIIFEIDAIDINSYDYRTKTPTKYSITFLSKYNYSIYKEYFDLLKDGDNIIKIINTTEFLIFNVKNNMGFVITEQSEKESVSVMMFYCNINKEDDRKEVCMNGEYFVLNSDDLPKTFQKDYSRIYRKYYYYSEDNGDCGWTQRESSPAATKKYLSSYGSAPNVLNGFFEQIARIRLHINKNEEVDYKYDSYVSESDTSTSIKSSSSSSSSSSSY